jgi:hypothetical protein
VWPRSRRSSLPDYRPVTWDALAAQLADWLTAKPGPVRVAVDGPPCAEPERLAASLADPLRALGRPLVHVPAHGFWRDASLRYEHGREDVDAYLGWLDDGALRREVLTGDHYLPSLRDPLSNRVTREPSRPLPDNAVLVVSGAFLLGLGLPYDAAVHLALSPAARARRTPPDDAWTLPAFDRYDADVSPAALADVVVRVEDPRRPAVTGLAK